MKPIFFSLAVSVAAIAGADSCRYMSFNIWGDYFGNPVGERDANVEKAILMHSPDIVSLQEVTPNWWASPMFANLEKAGYAIVRGDEKEALIRAGAPLDTAKWRKNWVNHEPLLYRTGRFELLDSGVDFFHFCLQAEKSATWAVLKDRRDGSRFITFATHFWYKTTAESDAIRELNARTIIARVAEIRHKWGPLPVVGGGDVNSEPGSFAHVAFDRAGYDNAVAIAEKSDGRPSEHGNPVRDATGVYRGKPGVSRDVPKGSCWIDHVFLTRGAFRVLRHAVVIDQCALDASDHSPVMVDFELIKR